MARSNLFQVVKSRKSQKGVPAYSDRKRPPNPIESAH